MNEKRSQLICGLIILILGLFVFLYPAKSLHFGSMFILACGLSLLLLYRTKRKSWALIIGSYAAWLGGASVLSGFIPNDGAFKNFFNNTFSSMFFIVPGIIFFVLYFEKNKRGLLFPASLLFWFGLNLFAGALPFISGGLHMVLFFLSMGMACLTPYIILRRAASKWTLFAACIMFALATFSLLGITVGFSKIFAFVLIVCALIIIFKNLKN